MTKDAPAPPHRRKPGPSRRRDKLILAGTILAVAMTSMGASLIGSAVAQTAAAPLVPAIAGCDLQPGPQRAVTGVPDAETLQLDDGSEVRLIGAMAPLAPHAAPIHTAPQRKDPPAAPWPLAQTSLRHLRDLVTGQTVKLAYGTKRSDRYGRRLAQVFLLGDGATQWLQGHLVETGLARAYALPDEPGCLAALLPLERRAREKKIGLWRNGAFDIRDARRAGALLRYANSYQLVGGRVVAVKRTKYRTYVNFGSDWRDDFTIVIDGKVMRNLARDGLRAAELTGRQIIVRGWVERRNGPFVRLHHGAQIELLDQ